MPKHISEMRWTGEINVEEEFGRLFGGRRFELRPGDQVLTARSATGETSRLLCPDGGCRAWTGTMQEVHSRRSQRVGIHGEDDQGRITTWHLELDDFRSVDLEHFVDKLNDAGWRVERIPSSPSL
jgi:hypothetical protein